MNTQQSAVDFRIGIFSFTALCFVVLAITFAGGDKGLLFKRTTTLTAHLADVGGLKTGSVVTMGGMTVGMVTKMRFSGEDQDCSIEVVMSILADIRDQIKTDSVPVVRTQGMLGDRYVEISKGSKDAVVLPVGKPLTGKGATDFDETLREAKSTLNETSKLLSAINAKEGTVGQLMYDNSFYSNLNDATLQLNEVLKDFKKDPRRYIKFSLF